MTLGITFVDLAGRTALCSTGDVLPIIRMTDAEGQTTKDPAAAASFLCGAGDLWFACRIDAFDWPTIH